MIRLLFSLIFTLAFALSARGDLIVRNPLAGFAGAFVPERFNLVSVEVQNVGAQPFEGVMALDDGGYGGGRVPLEQPLFVSPGATRWVQFYPYVTTGYQRWEISWRDKAGKGDSMPLRSEDNIKSSGPVTVIFDSPDSPRGQQSRLRPFLENLFPPSVVGTEGLYGAVLDHVPRWDALRRQAFRDWVYRGGVVHLLPGLDGKYPEFADELAPLNTTTPKAVFGAGRIVQHKETRAVITEANLERDPQLMSDGQGYMQDATGIVVNKLSDITRPNIPWGLIYLLTVVYVALIGPVFFLQRKRDYRVMLGAFLGMVLLFAWLFTVVGRRGYGEKQIVHSVGYAESLGGTRYVATQWMHAFATSSDSYRFAFPGPGHAYAALASSGTVRARVRSGADAALEADIPLFSGRPFIHSGTLTGDDTSVEVMEWKTRPVGGIDPGRLETFRLKPNADFPKAVEWMSVLYRGRVYKMALGDGEWVAEGSPFSTELNASFADKKIENNNWGRYSEEEHIGTTEERLKARLKNAGWLMMAKLTGANAYTRQRVTQPDLDADTAQLFIYARTPASLTMPGEKFQFGGGTILYKQTLHKSL